MQLGTKFRAENLSLYRDLIRNSRKIRYLEPLSILKVPTNQPENQIAAFKFELQRYESNRSQYLKNISTECVFLIKEEFGSLQRIDLKLITNDIQYKHVLYGSQISEVLETAIKIGQIIPVIVALISHRARQRAKIRHYLDKLEQKETVNEIAYEKLSDKKKAQLASRRKKHQADSAQADILQRFFKQAQTGHKVPNPFLLPYTENKNIPIWSLPKSERVIHRSSANLVLRNAYDWEYIESIVVPSIAFDINKDYYLNRLHDIVENKGPYNVKLTTTLAAPQPMVFLRTPTYDYKEMARLAFDIKDLVLLDRLEKIWNGTHDTTESENRDGSFTYKKPTESNPHAHVIFPKQHYEEWAELEALEMAFLKGHKDPSVEYHEWSKFIQDTTEYLASTNAKGWESSMKNWNKEKTARQYLIQKEMDIYYDNLVKKYDSLIDELGEKNVRKHQELVNIEVHYKSGLGKQLGDYLEKHGQKNYKFGDRFLKKFKFDGF